MITSRESPMTMHNLQRAPALSHLIHPDPTNDDHLATITITRTNRTHTRSLTVVATMATVITATVDTAMAATAVAATEADTTEGATTAIITISHPTVRIIHYVLINSATT